MPNWTNNNVIIVGTKEQLDKVETIRMDFQKIIPMPAPLYTDQMAERCAQCDSLMVKDDDDKFDKICKHCGIRDNIGGRVFNKSKLMWADKEGKLQSLDSDRFRQLNDKEQALALEWEKQYGTCSWYDWAVDNWGTKWIVRPDEVKTDRENDSTLAFNFDTAWACPYPILEELSRGYNVSMSVYCDNEGWENESFDVIDGSICNHKKEEVVR